MASSVLKLGLEAGEAAEDQEDEDLVEVVMEVRADTNDEMTNVVGMTYEKNADEMKCMNEEECEEQEADVPMHDTVAEGA